MLIMTPGPTFVDEKVRNAFLKETSNPDLDENFFEIYKDTCEDIKKIINTKNDVLILCGEGILGLEAACASLIEPYDKVLCIDNGIFGNGFADFAKIYNADITYFKSDYEKEIDVDKLASFLKENNDFKIATLVHCETPSGITNRVDKICSLLKKYNILTIVDSVSAIGGEDIFVDDWGIDIVIGGSQKCLSAPPGLTFVSISESAYEKILNRKSPIASFYANLAIWKNWYTEKWFPYTQPSNDIYVLQKAVQVYLQKENPIYNHKIISSALRQALINSGLKLYAKSGFSNTVTTIVIPNNISFDDLYRDMLNEGIMIGGAFSYLKNKVFRIGHMGENCYTEKIYITMKALDKVLRNLNVDLKCNLHNEFINQIKGC